MMLGIINLGTQMKLKPILLTLTSIVLLQACSSSSNSPRAVDAGPATNPGGDVVTGVIEAIFNPASGDPTQVPIPTNLFLLGTTDLTMNIPVADPTDFSDPLVAINALDGFSTVAPWSTNFSVPVADTIHSAKAKDGHHRETSNTVDSIYFFFFLNIVVYKTS